VNISRIIGVGYTNTVLQNYGSNKDGVTCGVSGTEGLDIWYPVPYAVSPKIP
jgi:hypothetical protein